jgi:hypothetical protein
MMPWEPRSEGGFVTRFVAFEDTEFQRVAADGYSFDSHIFFGSRKYSGPGPQVYMNNVDPGVTLGAHFHRIDQFQVFFGNDGARFQRKPIPSVFVHYADAFATYGPFSAAPEAPLLYATIRARSDNYGGVMPGARGERPYLGRRHLSAGVDGWEAAGRPADGAIRTVEIFRPAADGLTASLVHLGAGAAWTSPDARITSGRALCVLDGELQADEVSYGPRSIGWQARTDPALWVRAGAAGCALLMLDFPWPASETARQETGGRSAEAVPGASSGS